MDLSLLIKKLENCVTESELGSLKSEVMGKKGALTLEMAKLANLSGEARANAGKELNKLKEQFLSLYKKKKFDIENADLEESLKSEKLDLTLPSLERPIGKLHPLCSTMLEIAQIWKRLGFEMVTGPCIEDEKTNFDDLNIPPFHPARQDVDTFYLENGKLLRTHTSTIQIRYMNKNKPPFRVASVGRVFRRDMDATHTPVFHQSEALVVEEGITMGHLKGTIMDFLKLFFNTDKVSLRFRPSYFPFTEPSAEVDMLCEKEKYKITPSDKGDTWLEILGCGMVHPNVMKNTNLEGHRGFAIGMGIDRLTMLKYGICDARSLFDNQKSWLDFYGSYGFDKWK